MSFIWWLLILSCDPMHTVCMVLPCKRHVRSIVVIIQRRDHLNQKDLNEPHLSAKFRFYRIILIPSSGSHKFNNFIVFLGEYKVGPLVQFILVWGSTVRSGIIQWDTMFYGPGWTMVAPGALNSNNKKMRIHVMGSHMITIITIHRHFRA